MRPARTLLAPSALVAAWLLGACSSEPKGPPDLDSQLSPLLNAANVTALPAAPNPPQAQVDLGRALMFDKILSGNKNISCATCHHPTVHTTDGLPLSIGEGGSGLGPLRNPNGREFIPRGTPDLFNRGYSLWHTMFWDARVEMVGGQLNTPAGAMLPAGLSGVLAAQAMFPVTSPEEMRGMPGTNGMGNIPDTDLPQIWDSLMARLQGIPAYDALFTAAYPGVQFSNMGFEYAANAIGAFQAKVFTKVNTPFDAYLAGNTSALTDQEKRGAIIFFGKGQCGKCHLGPLLTDQKFHNIAVPQLGPGKAPEAPLDYGRARVTGNTADRFQYRTPPLRNVALTPPYFHDGAFTTLTAAVRHYINVTQSLQNYDPSQLPASLQNRVVNDPASIQQMLGTLDPLVPPIVLSDAEVADVVAFLNALTDPSAIDMSAEVPVSVPSGLPVTD